MKKAMNKGITLVSLVITIIVLLIIVGITVNSLISNNMKTRESVFSTLIGNLKDEYDLYVSDKKIDEYDFDRSSINASSYDELKKYMSSINEDNYRKFNIINGKLAYVDNVDWEIEIAKRMGLLISEEGTDIYSPSLESVIEDFENEVLKFSYTGDWLRTNENPIEGNYSYRSNMISDWQKSTSILEINVPDNGFEYDLNFDYFVSSEGGSDRFSIFCNEKEIINDGGIFSEKKNITINLNTGNNVIKFEYSKDGSVSYGEDLAKIDNLVYRIREYTAPIIRTNNKDDYNVRVSIIYPEVVTKKLYSIDNGNTWKNYNGAFDVTSGTLVYAKYLGNNDEDSDIASLIANYNLGSEIEDFESNDLIFDFEGDWERTKDYKMSGRYSYRSKKIGGFESSVTVTNIIIPDDGTEYNLYFDYLVSSEEGHDIFEVWVNQNQVLNVSGEKENHVEVPLRTGNNEIKFKYYKDGSVDSGKDLVLIDNIKYYQRTMTAPTISYKNADNFTLNVEILYPNWAETKLYSYDGVTWLNYSDIFNVNNETVIYAKYINGLNQESAVVSIEAKYSFGTDIENFETSNLSFNFEGDWERTKDYSINDRYSYRSKQIGSFETSSTEVNIDVPDNGSEYNLYFNYLVSSEEGHDIFSVYVNGTKVLNVSGERNSYLEIPLEVGNNVVVFEYKKDQTLDLGYDLALIDNMQLKLRGLTNPVITNENSSTANKLKVKIIWPSNAYKKEYSIDGDNWNEYIDVFEVDTNTIIYAKYTTGTNLTSPIVSREVVYSYGSEIENFETEDFVFSYMGEWYRTKEHVINDRFSLINKKIGGNQQTTEIMEFTVPNDGYDYILYFNYRVSSEGGIDRFRVIYNENEKLSVSGEQSSFCEIDVNPGENEITFSYSKDGSVDAGFDGVIIDDIQVKRK